jgi:starch synthase (maltosyl-transferring)
VKPPIIYNLFPRLVGPTTRWSEHGHRAQDLGFNWIYLNPWYYPGFSGSLYAPKDYRRLNPLFLPPGVDEHSLEPLRDFLREMDSIGMPVMLDLVVNHTAKDSPLVREHPGWFVRDDQGEIASPYVRDPDDPSIITVWGDLAEIDNRHAEDRNGLWAFWAELVRESIELGFAGFRCDAAYMVPAELWRYLVEVAERRRPDTSFFAETLGASIEQVLELHGAGLDFFFNSSKWWNFRDSWALEQHGRFGAVAPSISFPESHDTPRLADETAGDEAVQRQRYAFAAAFSAGLMMPIGYEYGFRTKMDVVHTLPTHWEQPSFDLSGFVARVNRLKVREPALQGEGHLSTPRGLGDDVLVLERLYRDDGLPAYIVVNTDTLTPRELQLSFLPRSPEEFQLLRICRDDAPDEGVRGRLLLERAEVVYLLPRSEGRRV